MEPSDSYAETNARLRSNEAVCYAASRGGPSLAGELPFNAVQRW
jgi:hypothetical protein